MTRPEDLIIYWFEGKNHVLKPTLTLWMARSSRFTGFADKYRDKIRKKIRVIQDPGTIGDLQRELLTAYMLLNERRFEITYEPYASEKKRGPDFSVTYRTNTVFNVEVTRIRGTSRQMPQPAQNHAPAQIHPDRDPPLLETGRLVELILDKFGQMQPGMINILIIYNDDPTGRLPDLGDALQRLKLQAEHKDPALFNRARFQDSSDFFKYFQRLSAVLIFQLEQTPSGRPDAIWINKQARPPLADKLAAALGRLKTDE
jgi:hypothetical protein